MMIKTFVKTIAVLIVLLFAPLWFLSNFEFYIHKSSFKNVFGVEAPLNREIIVKHLFSMCSFSLLSECYPTHRFVNVSELEYKRVAKEMKLLGFDRWQKWEDSDSSLPYYPPTFEYKRDKLISVKDFDNRKLISIVYHPTNRTLEFSVFYH